MSSRQLEEMQERNFTAWLVSETGFSADDLDGHVLDEIGNDDGALYGYEVTLVDGRTARVGIPPD